MHYLGNAGVANYYCHYNVAYVVASIIVAITACCVALTMFFRLQKNFTNSLWKRMLAALVLAIGVTGMHWTAVSGTKYRPHSLKEGRPIKRGLMLTLTLVVSLIACAGLLAFGIMTGRKKMVRMHRVQKVTLVTASFDDEGRIMVLPDGTLPTKIITDKLKEKVRSRPEFWKMIPSWTSKMLKLS